MTYKYESKVEGLVKSHCSIFYKILIQYVMATISAEKRLFTSSSRLALFMLVYSLVMILVVDVQAALKQPPILQALTDEFDFIDDLNLNLIRAKDKFFVKLTYEGDVLVRRFETNADICVRDVFSFEVDPAKSQKCPGEKTDTYIDIDTKDTVVFTISKNEKKVLPKADYVIIKEDILYTTLKRINGPNAGKPGVYQTRLFDYQYFKAMKGSGSPVRMSFFPAD